MSPSERCEKMAPHLCPASIRLPRLLRPAEGNPFPPFSIRHAIKAQAASVVCTAQAMSFVKTSCVGILHGFVGPWMGSGDCL